MKRKLLISLLLLAYVSFSYADNVKDLISKVNSKDYPGADIVVVFDSTTVEVQPTGLSYVDNRVLYKVMTVKGGLRLNTIIFDYDPLSAFVEIKKVLIYREDGTKKELDVSKVYDYPQPARAIYWGARQKMIEIGRLNPGDAVEVFMFRKGFTYALLGNDDDDKYIPPMRGHFYDIVNFYNSDPMVEKVYIVKVPRDKEIQYEFYNGEVRSSVVLRGEHKILTFAKKDISPMKREASMVSQSDVAPKLLISTSPDWYAKSTWFYSVNEDFGSFNFTPEIKAKVDEILVGAVDELDSVSRLTHWAADEIRYSGISMGEGEGFTLHKGEMTFLDRCGVCKDKAGMLVTLLRAAGFESYAAMTMAGSRIDYIPADQFNHSVTVVKLSDGKYHLLDPTWVPFLRELWSSAEQQQNYLMGLPEGADLAITPVSPAENHYIRINGKSALDENGTLSGEVVVTAEGQSDGAIRGMFTRNYVNLWDRSVESEIRSVFPEARITKAEYGEPYDYMAGPIKLVIGFEIPEYAIVTDDKVILQSFVGSGIFQRAMGHLYFNTDIESRQYPFRDRCSRLVELKESITVPGQFDLVYYPSEDEFFDETASYMSECKLEKDGSELHIFLETAFNKRIYEPGEWKSFKSAVLAQKALMDEPIILQKKAGN